MKNLILVFALCFMLVAESIAQIKIESIVFPTGFGADTATSISLRVVSLDVEIESSEQRPTFYLAFRGNNGSIIKDRNINWDDLKIACTKKGYADSLHATIIQSAISATLCGTKTQKLAAIRNLLSVYAIIVKPDDEQ